MTTEPGRQLRVITLPVGRVTVREREVEERLARIEAWTESSWNDPLALIRRLAELAEAGRP